MLSLPFPRFSFPSALLFARPYFPLLSGVSPRQNGGRRRFREGS